MNLQQLVERMIAGDVGAFDQVVAAGEPAIAVLAAAIEGRKGAIMASAALARLELDNRVAALAALIQHASYDVQNAAIRALAIRPDPRALAPLVEALSGGKHFLPTLRAIGDLGEADGITAIQRTLTKRFGADPADGEGRAEIVQRATDDVDPTDLIEIAYGAEALAKLGDFSMCETAVDLAKFDPGLDIGFDEAGSVRQYAVRALDVMVGSRIVAALDAASRDEDPEAVAAAARASLHLGRKRAVSRWLELAGRDDELAGTAFDCLERLVGERPDPDDDLAAWWKARASKLESDVCYSFGKLATPAELVARARAAGSAGDRAELAQMTGCAFLAPEIDDPPASVIAELDKWWAANASRFTPGKLHRWGRTYEPDAVK